MDIHWPTADSRPGVSEPSGGLSHDIQILSTVKHKLLSRLRIIFYIWAWLDQINMWMILLIENEDCCFTTEPGAAPGQSYLCIPFQKEGNTAAGADDDGDEYCPSVQVPGTPPCRKSPGGGRRSELVLLGCGALLAAVGLGCNLLTLSQPEENIKSRWEGFFHRTGGQRRSTSPPTRRLFRRESPLKPSAPSLPERGLPSSYTLLSLSSVSDCNSTRSLLRNDSEELLVCRPASPPRVSQHQAAQPPVNPLVNTHLESFKRNPRQSLTPTHVPSAPSSSRSLRRTPSDGAIKKSCLPNNLEPLPEKTALESTGKVLNKTFQYVNITFYFLSVFFFILSFPFY